MKITRREFALGTCALALAASPLAGWPRLRSRWQPALAQDRSDGRADAAGPARRYGARRRQGAGHHHRIRLDDLPALRAFPETTFPELKKRYIDTGKVRFIFREFPLDPARGRRLHAGALLHGKDADKRPQPINAFAMIETLFAQQHDWVVQKPLAAAARTSPSRPASPRRASTSAWRIRRCSTASRRCASAPRRSSSVEFDARPSSSMARRCTAAMSIEEIEKVIDPYLKSG